MNTILANFILMSLCSLINNSLAGNYNSPMTSDPTIVDYTTPNYDDYNITNTDNTDSPTDNTDSPTDSILSNTLYCTCHTYVPNVVVSWTTPYTSYVCPNCNYSYTYPDAKNRKFRKSKLM